MSVGRARIHLHRITCAGGHNCTGGCALEGAAIEFARAKMKAADRRDLWKRRKRIGDAMSKPSNEALEARIITQLGDLPCMFKGCSERGIFKPVIHIAVPESGKTHQMEVEVGVCSIHQQNFDPSLLLRHQRIWDILIHSFPSMGMKIPYPEHLSLHWGRWSPDVVVA